MKPALIVVALILVVVGGLKCAEKSAVFQDWYGHPLDWAGDWVICPQCPSVDGERAGELRHVSGYTYRCERCGTTAIVRRNANTGKVEVHPKPH